MTHNVQLLVGPSAIDMAGAWDEYSITLSMLVPGSAFTFTFWRSDQPNTAWSVLTDKTNGIHAGDLCSLRIDGDVVLEGRIETRVQGADPEHGAHLTVSGRDLAGPALEAHANPRLVFRGLALDAALTQLFAGVGLTVQVSATVDPTVTIRSLRTPRQTRTGKVSRGATLDLAHPRVGETVWEVGHRLCRKLGYMIWVAPAGADTSAAGLVVDTPHYTGTAVWNLTRIERGGRVTQDSNILAGAERTSLSKVPTVVTDYGNALRGDTQAARLANSLPNAALTDPVATNGRLAADLFPSPRYLRSDHAHSVRDARGEAARMIAEANTQLRTYQCTVHGHSSAPGLPLFRPNALAAVQDDIAQVRETMLVHDLTFARSAKSGTTTKLTLGPIGAIQLFPVNV